MSVLGAPSRDPALDETPKRRWRVTDSYLFVMATLVILVAVSLDPTNFLSKGSANGGSSSRYVIVIVPVALAAGMIIVRGRHVRMRVTWADLVLIVLTVWGLLGSLVGRLADQVTTTALPIFIPMVIASMHLVTSSPMTDTEVRSVLRKVTFICLLFAFLDAVVNTGISQTLLADDSFRQYKAYLLAIAIAGALVQRKWGQALLASLLSLYVYYKYKALSYPLTFVMAIGTLVITRPRGLRVRLAWLTPIVAVFIAWVLFNFNTVIAYANTYFNTVDKVNNTSTRLQLWHSGLGVFQQSPIYGSNFTGSVNVAALVAGNNVLIPVHCDFIQMMMGGGLIALGLYVSWIALTNFIIVKRHQAFVDKGLADHARLLRVLLIGFNCFWAISLFNPILENLGTAASFFAIYAIMMALQDPVLYDVKPASEAVAGRWPT